MKLIKVNASWCRLYDKEELEYQKTILGNEDDCDPDNREIGPVVIDLESVESFNPLEERISLRFKSGSSIQIAMSFDDFSALMQINGFEIIEP